MKAIASVIRAEGLRSAGVRAIERLSESSRNRLLQVRGTFTKPGPAVMLNISATPVAARFGGVPTQLASRIAQEKHLRPTALLHDGLLELSEPLLHARSIDGDLESSTARALELTGARAIHLEGTAGVPLAALIRIARSGIRVVLGIHDFSLFCVRPHLVQLPGEEPIAPDDLREQRALARDLLLAAAVSIFPSAFLLERHRALFGLPDLRGVVIEPSSAAPSMREDGGERRSIAFAGSVKPHKGGGLLPEIIRRSGDVAQWHVFGGGDAELLEPLRRLPRTSVHGYYRAGTLPSHLARNGVGLLVIPSIVPETFSLVLSEAWLAGVPVIAFDAGAPAERIRRDGGGWLVPLEEGAEGIAAVARKWLSGNLATDVPAKVPTGSEAARATIETYRELQLL